MKRFLFIGGPLDSQILYAEFKPTFILNNKYHYYLRSFDYGIDFPTLITERQNIPIFILCELDAENKEIAKQIIELLELDLRICPLN